MSSIWDRVTNAVFVEFLPRVKHPILKSRIAMLKKEWYDTLNDQWVLETFDDNDKFLKDAISVFKAVTPKIIAYELQPVNGHRLVSHFNSLHVLAEWTNSLTQRDETGELNFASANVLRRMAVNASTNPSRGLRAYVSPEPTAVDDFAHLVKGLESMVKFRTDCPRDEADFAIFDRVSSPVYRELIALITVIEEAIYVNNNQ